jgi:hypothetical protein
MLACSVIVGNGSGVLIQPMSDAYTYVLTAKHVVAAHINEINKVQVENVEGKIIRISDCLIDPVHDIAILKTSEAISSDLNRCIDDVKADEKIHLLGYPSIRRNKPHNRDKSVNHVGQATIRISSDNFSIALDSQPGHDQLNGMSGCGVFRQIEEKIYLCGIEFRVEGDPNKEYHGRVECVPLSKFDDLISKNSEHYAQILPPYLLCFSRIKTDSFKFKGAGTPESLDFLREELYCTIDGLMQRALPTPLELYNQYKDNLLIHNSPPQSCLSIELWIAFLEFIVISSLIDNQQEINRSYLSTIFSKRRLLFSITENNWQMLLNDILMSNLKGLGQNGVVIIDAGSCIGDFQPSKKTLENVITNIGRRGYTKMMIDAPITNPAKAFKFYHWKGLHRQCVILKEDEYAEFNAFAESKNATDVLTKIKDDYAQFLGQ